MERDVPALFVNDKIDMLKSGFLVFLLIMLTTTAIKAQRQPDHFLTEMFSINSFKLNASVEEIQKNKNIADNLSLLGKMDNWSTYFLSGQKINLPGLKALDVLAFDTLELSFENNKLHDVVIRVPGRFKGSTFTKTINQFNSKYGNANISSVENNRAKKYVWTLGPNEITIQSYHDGFGIGYGSKTKTKLEKSWIYSSRKGKGNGTIQLTLSYFEKLLKSKLTIASFEKLLPSWETTGLLNHVNYMPTFKTKVSTVPFYSISYSLNNCNLRINTRDTTSKIISEYTLEQINDTKLWAAFDESIKNLNYQIGPKIKYSNNLTYSNREKRIMVFLNKPESRISISDIRFPLP